MLKFELVLACCHDWSWTLCWAGLGWNHPYGLEDVIFYPKYFFFDSLRFIAMLLSDTIRFGFDSKLVKYLRPTGVNMILFDDG